MKKVAVLQSSYIPWKGYFDIIHDVDLFIFYDDVQYTKNDWRNRNLIKTRNGPTWLTIPTGKNIRRLIYEVEISDNRWASKHWKSLQQSYSKAPFFEYYREFFEQVYLKHQWRNLTELNQYIVREISARFLGIKTEFADSRTFTASGYKSERLLDLLKKVGADLYLSGPSAKEYIDAAGFKRADIRLEYKSYEGYPAYPQNFPPFAHQVSIIDLLFNTGPDASKYIWGWRNQDHQPTGLK